MQRLCRKTWNSKLKTECCALTVQSLSNLSVTDENGSFAVMNAAGSGGNKMQIKSIAAMTQCINANAVTAISNSLVTEIRTESIAAMNVI